jgi:hypothetical protein
LGREVVPEGEENIGERRLRHVSRQIPGRSHGVEDGRVGQLAGGRTLGAQAAGEPLEQGWLGRIVADRDEGGIGTLARLDTAACDHPVVHEQRLGIGRLNQGLELWSARLRIEHDRRDPATQQSKEDADRGDVVVGSDDSSIILPQFEFAEERAQASRPVYQGAVGEGLGTDHKRLGWLDRTLRTIEPAQHLRDCALRRHVRPHRFRLLRAAARQTAEAS